MVMWGVSLNGVVVDTTDVDPTGRYNATLVCAICPAGTAVGDTWNGTAFVKAVPVAPAPAARIVSSNEFMNLFTPAETAALWSADPLLMCGAMKVITQGTANLDSAEAAELLSLAVSKGVLSDSEKTRILAGTPPSTPTPADPAAPAAS